MDETLAGPHRLTLASSDTRRAVVENERENIVVVANREPYSHERSDDGAIITRRAAGGLVTGVEPLLRRTGGTWVAAATGSADDETADERGRIEIEDGGYTLQRLWFDGTTYERYYGGFANEALWPLCHTAFARPVFRPADWTAYQAVNNAFAAAAVEEIRGAAFILVQDYHFALVPRLVRNAAPQTITNIFWHIPWPNAEVFGICPWKEALLEGILGADVVGFHTRRYCLNFLETAQRYVECRVDAEEMSITFHGDRTLVRPYPISVEWPYPAASRDAGRALRRTLGVDATAHVSVGVDRADYTKGLLERVASIDVMLEKRPDLRGRYVHVQVASPTRTTLRQYQDLAADLHESVSRVNERFGTDSWKPIVFQSRTVSPEEVRDYYAMADSAIVTPLHDGMNLVAKEYVASCADEDGVLVLSAFAGAASELDGALLVNPFDIEATAEAIASAVRMDRGERRQRMREMRRQVATHSISDWSETMLDDLRTIQRASARTARPKRRTGEFLVHRTGCATAGLEREPQVKRLSDWR